MPAGWVWGFDTCPTCRSVFPLSSWGENVFSELPVSVAPP